MKIVQHCKLSCPKECNVLFAPQSGLSLSFIWTELAGWVYTGPQSPVGLFGHAVCVCAACPRERKRECVCVWCADLSKPQTK